MINRAGGGIMQKSLQLAVVFLLLLLVLLPPSTFAEGPHRRHEWGSGMLRRGCVGFDDLGLSEAQKVALEKVERQFTDKVFSLRNRLMIKRLELQGLLRDPQADEKAIREKAREVGILKSELREKTIDVQIEIRAILTPEQIRLWCTMEWSPLMRGWKRDRERR